MFLSNSMLKLFIPIWFRSCYAVGGTLLKTNFNSHSYTLPQDITASFLSFNLILWLYPQKQNVCVVKEMGCFPMETFAIFFLFFSPQNKVVQNRMI